MNSTITPLISNVFSEMLDALGSIQYTLFQLHMANY